MTLAYANAPGRQSYFSGTHHRIKAACNCDFMFWNRVLLPTYFADVYDNPTDAHNLQYMMMAINDTFPLLERAVHNPVAIIREFENEVERLLEQVRRARAANADSSAHVLIVSRAQPAIFPISRTSWTACRRTSRRTCGCTSTRTSSWTTAIRSRSASRTAGRSWRCSHCATLAVRSTSKVRFDERNNRTTMQNCV